LAALAGVAQDPRWHPEGDVWVHTLMVVDAAAKLVRQPERGLSEEEVAIVLFGALLHDLGKPATTRTTDSGITAHGHEAAGHRPALQFLQRIRLGEAVEVGVLECVTEHMRPSQLTREMVSGKLSSRQSLNALRRLLKDVRKAGWKAFVALCEADKRGRGHPEERDLPYEPALHLNPLVDSADPELLSLDSLLQGKDLLAMGLEPGPRIGRLIAQVEQLRDGGLVATRSEALEWLREHLKEGPVGPR
jgi:tRNA nucleotidyltransferase (CCA-adding enzyme)